MGKIGLQLKATLENVTHLRPVGDDFRWYLKMKCGNCGEVSEKWQYIRLMDSVPLKGGRGSATMVQKCKLCSRDNSIDSGHLHWLCPKPAVLSTLRLPSSPRKAFPGLPSETASPVSLILSASCCSTLSSLNGLHSEQQHQAI
uniref:CXXC motif containing zinc binding protein n=1 Tax=Phascolarctos cinereus TaxID=38626 RepID=A0A6P5KDA3_PHACI|nr:UPF0587 protein C1orf123 homolog isoform X3 [Phascolarctos cinereus]